MTVGAGGGECESLFWIAYFNVEDEIGYTLAYSTATSVCDVAYNNTVGCLVAGWYAGRGAQSLVGLLVPWSFSAFWLSVSKYETWCF